MGLVKSFMSPERFVVRASSLLLASGGGTVATAAYDLAANRTVIRCAHTNVLRLGIVYAEGAAGGAVSFIGEGFDGVTWERATLDNVGSLTVLTGSAAGSGTASLVDEFVKQMQPRATFASGYVVLLGKAYIAFRFGFAEYPAATQATPGTCSAAVMLGAE